MKPVEEVGIPILIVHCSPRKNPGTGYEPGAGVALEKEDLQTGPSVPEENESGRWPGLDRRIWGLVQGTEEPWR